MNFAFDFSFVFYNEQEEELLFNEKSLVLANLFVRFSLHHKYFPLPFARYYFHLFVLSEVSN